MMTVSEKPTKTLSVQGKVLECDQTIMNFRIEAKNPVLE